MSEGTSRPDQPPPAPPPSGQPSGQPVGQSGVSLRLWPEGAPETSGCPEQDQPTLTPFFPATRGTARTAVVICPGGGYGQLMLTYEGRDVADWLNRYGVVALVLKYRISPHRHPAPLLDGQRAVRLARARASAWGLDPGRIGMLGFSAGGHLAATVGTHFDAGSPQASDPIDRTSCRPDFLMLVYPVITMGEQGHAGSRANLLGPQPGRAEIEWLSNERHVTAHTPPAFLVHARTDKAVPVANSALFHAALRTHGVDSEFLELPEGGHGLGAGRGALWEAWQGKALEWLKARGLVGT